MKYNSMRNLFPDKKISIEEKGKNIKRYTEALKLNQRSKTIFALHKEKSNLKRYREFWQQNSIEPYAGLKEILFKKDLDQVLKEQMSKRQGLVTNYPRSPGAQQSVPTKPSRQKP
jgi:hypothetical protein